MRWTADLSWALTGAILVIAAGFAFALLGCHVPTASPCAIACADKGGVALESSKRVCICTRLNSVGFSDGSRFTVVP